MNYETEIKDRLANGDSAAEIAEAINTERRANPANYRPVKSHEVANWLASNGMESRIEKWIVNKSANPYFDVLFAAYQGIKAIRGNIQATMRVAPGEDHRSLILLAIDQSAMLEVDLTTIDKMAYTAIDETAETVQAAIDTYDSDAAQWQRFVTAGAAIIEAGGTLTNAITAGNTAAGIE
jgi:hypothetical protein